MYPPPLFRSFGCSSSAYPIISKPSFGISNLLNSSLFLDAGDDRLVKQELITGLDLGLRPIQWAAPMDGRKTNKTLELYRRLKENIPWQSEFVQSISDLLSIIGSDIQEGVTWMLIKGNDGIAKRRLLMVIADHVSRSSVDNHGPVHVNARNTGDKTDKMNMELIIQGLQKKDSVVVMIENVDCADASFVKFLTQIFETESFTDDTGRRRSIIGSNVVFILITKSDHSNEREAANVIGMKLQMEGEAVHDDGIAVTFTAKDLKRKPKPLSSDRNKNLRKTESILDLNVKAECVPDDDDNYNDSDEEKEDNVLSDVTRETNWRKDDSSHTKLLGLITTCYVLDSQPEHSYSMSEYIISRLTRAFEEHVGNNEMKNHRRCLHIDPAVVEEMVGKSGSFLVDLFEKWIEEVFQASLRYSFKNGGNVRLSLDCKMENILVGYKLSCLPCRIHVD